MDDLTERLIVDLQNRILELENKIKKLEELIYILPEDKEEE